MTYSERTLGDPNPIKRYLQNSRFSEALGILKGLSSTKRMLDFGGGDGELCIRTQSFHPDSELICYEPAPGMYSEAEEKLRYHPRIRLTNSLKEMEAGTFDVVTSLEVFEHLPEKELAEALNAIDNLLSKDGVLIIGVPNELHLAALYKGVFRMLRRYGAYDAQLGNIAKCIVGRPPRNRPLRNVSKDKMYYFEHLGFNHYEFFERLKGTFVCQRQINSPYKFLPKFATPEIYYVLKKHPRRDGMYN
jgi:SAM-dependent methyltransferase